MTRNTSRERILWTLTVLLLVYSAILGVVHTLRSRETRSTRRAFLDSGIKKALIPLNESGLAVSADGSRIAFIASNGNGPQQIWVRNLSSMDSVAVDGTKGAFYPFWSPDGRRLGFFANGTLWKVDVQGGSPEMLADAPSGRGGCWSRNDIILFAPTARSPISSVPAAGGKVTQITRLNPKNDITHRWPVFLPDNQHFLFVSRAQLRGSALGRLMIGDLKTHASTLLINDATNAAYVHPGYLFYGRSSTLYAQLFDAGRLALTGSPVPVIKEKLSYWEPKNYWAFSASENGTIVHLPQFRTKSVLRWYNRSGYPLETVTDTAYQWDHRLSPDGKKIVYVRSEKPNSQPELWVYDLDQKLSNKISTDGQAAMEPEWSPDGTQLTFVCEQSGVKNICVMDLKGSENIHQLFQSTQDAGQPHWSPDGKRILFTLYSPGTSNDLWIVDAKVAAPTINPHALLQSPFEETEPRFSPDGRWICYVSTETGRREIYLHSANSAQNWKVSIDGGDDPRWKGDGSEIFFVSPNGELLSAPVATNVPSYSGHAKALFRLPEAPVRNMPVFEDVSADGQRFLLNIPVQADASVDFHLNVNGISLNGKVQ